MTLEGAALGRLESLRTSRPGFKFVGIAFLGFVFF
jgi:hypothetical protein